MDTERLEQRLAKGGLSAAELKRIAAEIKPLADLDFDEIFTLGIVMPDGIRGRAEVAPGRVAGITDALVADRDSPVRSWRVFPIGIVAPERFKIEVDIGRRLG